jgi:hypothetical protein
MKNLPGSSLMPLIMYQLRRVKETLELEIGAHTLDLHIMSTQYSLPQDPLRGRSKFLLFQAKAGLVPTTDEASPMTFRHTTETMMKLLSIWGFPQGKTTVSI